ncbi:hypothetical protein V8F20_007321 [Naviculisporaceae sp. PSN 640]
MGGATLKWSLTEHLLQTYQSEFQTATQHPFLLSAAEGRLPKDVLGKWLANDRLYIHSYIRAAGKLLSSIDLPPTAPESAKEEAPETQLVDWLIEALTAVRREERLFIDVAERYGLDINLDTFHTSDAVGTKTVSIDETAKLPGLVMIEDIFGNITQSSSLVIETASASGGPPKRTIIPWLEGAVTFWGTERCYLEAWSWAKAKQAGGADAKEDADGGALRKEFIPNWSSVDFARFVQTLGSLIDFAVSDVLERVGEGDVEDVKNEILGRVEEKWKNLLVAEASFWPQLE